MRNRFYRIADIFLATTALIASLPLMLIMATMVAITMGRPIMFHQRRMGRYGVAFRLTKFRSMTYARDLHGTLLPDGERTTSLGAIMRRTRLDELPELWNILAGHMSLIGPRPLLPETVAAMGADGERRGRVRPGLTGWAQICGNSALNNADKLTLDLWYIENRSVRLDLFVLARTIGLMLLGETIDHARLERAWAERPRSGLG